MKRIDIIKKLIGEGFSEKTLVGFNDKQLEKLSAKVLREGLKVKADDIKSDPALADKLKDKDVTIVPEEDDTVETIKKGDLKQKKSALNMKKLNAFVESVVDKKFHTLATKKEISELIKEKFNNITEKNTISKLPEFIGEFEMAEPAVKPAPVKPGIDTPKREKPRHPGQRPLDPNKQPIPNPAPKAKAKEISGDDAKSKVIKMINKIFVDN